MTKIFLGRTSIICAVIILCTGFILSALESVHDTATMYAGGGSFTYSIFNINWFWFIVPVILIVIGFSLLYSRARNRRAKRVPSLGTLFYSALGGQPKGLPPLYLS